MIFHDAEMSMPISSLASIPFYGWASISAIGAFTFYFGNRAGAFCNQSAPSSIASFLAVLGSVVLAIAILVAPMLAILSALNGWLLMANFVG